MVHAQGGFPLPRPLSRVERGHADSSDRDVLQTDVTARTSSAGARTATRPSRAQSRLSQRSATCRVPTSPRTTSTSSNAMSSKLPPQAQRWRTILFTIPIIGATSCTCL